MTNPRYLRFCSSFRSVPPPRWQSLPDSPAPSTESEQCARPRLLSLQDIERHNSLQRKDRVDDFVCAQNGASVAWEIDVQSGVHMFIRVIRSRVSHDCDFVAKLGGKANRCLNARVCYEADNDELVDTMPFE